MNTYDMQINIYDLGDNVFLQKAELDDFCKFFMFYRQGIMPYEHYDLLYNNIKLELADISGNIFWLYNENIRTAGLVLSPNLLSSLFFIPSKKQPEIRQLIQKLDEILSLWSAKDKPIQIICDNDLISDIFTSMNYKIINKRYCMLKPTHNVNVTFEQTYHVRNIQKQDIQDLARFFCLAHVGSSDDLGISDEAVNNRISQLEYYVNMFEDNNTLDCSCMVIDNSINQIIGACIAGKDESSAGFAGIVDVAVLPNYRGKKIATNMLNRAIGFANKTCPAIILGVTGGNNACQLYKELGFYEFMVRITLQH
jgi:ribosomal protein S18 acetylase RimI-like enzyme